MLQTCIPKERAMTKEDATGKKQRRGNKELDSRPQASTRADGLLVV